YPREPALPAARHQAAGPAHRGGEAVPRRPREVAARRDGLPVDPGHPPPDPRLRPDRLAGRPGRVDRGEVPRVERLRRRRGAALHQGRAAHQRDDLLGDRQHQRLVLALLRPLPHPVADRRRPAHRGADRLRRLPEGDRAPAPLVGRAHVQHQTLDRHAGGGALRGRGGAGGPGGGWPRRAGSLLVVLPVRGWVTLFEPGGVVAREIRVPIERWPDGVGPLRIAAVADVHAGAPHTTPEALGEIVATVNAARPDVIVLLGDYVIHGIIGGRFIEPEP